MGAQFHHLWCYAIAVAAAITGFGSLLVFGLFLWTGGFELVNLALACGGAIAASNIRHPGCADPNRLAAH